MDTPIYLAAVLFLGVAAQWLAWRLRLPAIVLLLAAGFGLGVFVGPPEGHVGSEALLPLVSLAVGVILFEGGLSLQWGEIRETRAVVLRLVTVSLLVTWGGATLAAYYLMGFSWSMATLLGALLTVSGPTVIMPLLRQVRPNGRVGSVIKWEGIVNDPIGAVIAALVFEAVAHSGGHDVAAGDWAAGEWAMMLGKTAGIGVLLGAATAWLIVYLLKNYLLPDYLQNPVVLGTVVLVFAISNALAEESGLVTVTVLGVILANQKQASIKHVIEFKENLRVLLIAVLFVVLSSRVQLGWGDLGQIGLGGLGFVAALILVVRPVATLLATVGSDLTRNERLLLSWIHPRGIVAAAVASFFALQMQENEELAAEGDKLVLATFLVIVGTVLTYGLTLGPLARRLGLSTPNPQGVLFAGAGVVARQLAESISNEGIPTLLVDTNPQNVQTARMAGLRAHYASIGSDFVHRGLDLGGVGRLLAMTPNDEVNTLAASEFRELFGSENIYQVAPSQKEGERQRKIPAHLRGRLLLDDETTSETLGRRFAEGAVLKKTSLSEGFTMEDFLAKYGDTARVLCTFPEAGRLMINTKDQPLELGPGVKVLALVDPPAGGFDAAESGVLG